MAILNAATQAQKQIFNHLLTELEAMGAVTLADARVIMAREVINFRQGRMKRESSLAVSMAPHCPEENCTGTVRRYPRKDLDGVIITIDKCDKCQKSWIVEQTV